MQLQQSFITSPVRPAPAISLIGMAGAGKSTVGKILARELNWTFMDSDCLIEATYGARLQDITDALGKTVFLDVEAKIVSAIRIHRAVIATGGSVVYREESMRHLSSLGPIIFLDVPFPLIEERVARNPERGIAMAPGESLKDLFCERYDLYLRYADIRCPAGEDFTPQMCARWIIDNLPQEIRGDAP
ncbi:MAG: shikimate kinase [Desulfovibrio sp.]|nr:shikimate kinase [Desulfovibrio sp.]